MKKNIFSSFGFKVFLIVGLTIITSAVVTYGFFNANKSQSGVSSISTSCFDVTFTDGNSISLKNATSMTDTSGMNTTPYTFSVTNNCDNETSYTVILSSKDGSFSDEFISTSLDEDEVRILSNITENRIYDVSDGYSSSYILEQGSIKKGETASFNLHIWINASATYEDVKDKTWEGEVQVVSGIKEVEDARILSNKIKTIAKDTSVDFTKVSIIDDGVYTLEDNDGTSYYYRGANNYNYVLLGNLYFRIVRLNGDGSLRLYYDGTMSHSNGELSSDRIAKEDVQVSNLEDELNNWYQENITNNNLDKYMTSSSYCSDALNTSQVSFKCSSITNSKVGLLSPNEVIAMGASTDEENGLFAPFKGYSYFLGGIPSEDNVYILNEVGLVTTTSNSTTSGLVPVINLSKDYVGSLVGTGTNLDPYTL